MRPLATITGICFFVAIDIMFGQTSSSIKSKRAGLSFLIAFEAVNVKSNGK